MPDRGHELAKQHGEAAIADLEHDLAPPVQRLDTVGDPHPRADSLVVERTDDPLASPLAHPVNRPQRYQPGVGDEDRVVGSGVADRPGDRLRMDLVLAACWIRLLVEHPVPCHACNVGPGEERAVGALLQLVEQHPDSRPHRADDAQLDPGATPQHGGPLVYLDDVAALGQPLAVRIVGAEHEQQIGALDRVQTRPGADQADTADPMRVVERQHVLAAIGVHQGRPEAVGQCDQPGLGAAAAGAAQHRHRLRPLDQPDGRFDVVGRGRDFGAGAQGRQTRRHPGDLRWEHVLWDVDVGDATRAVRLGNRLVQHLRRHLGRGDDLGVDGHVTEQQVGRGFLDIVDPAKCSGHTAGDGEHGRVV